MYSRLLLAMCFITMVISLWITNTAATTMVVPIIFALLKVFEDVSIYIFLRYYSENLLCTKNLWIINNIDLGIRSQIYKNNNNNDWRYVILVEIRDNCWHEFDILYISWLSLLSIGSKTITITIGQSASQVWPGYP